MNFIYYENMKPIVSIEIGTELSVNYIHKFYNIKNLFDYKELEKVLAGFSKIFRYDKVYYHFNYKNYSEFENKYSKNTKPFLYINYYCSFFYSRIKNNLKEKLNKYWQYSFGFWKLDQIMDQKISEKDKTYWNISELKTYKDLYIYIVENKFHKYKKMTQKFSEIGQDRSINKNPFHKEYFIFDSLKYLFDFKYIKTNPISLIYNLDEDYGDIYNIINRNPLIRK